MAVLTKTLFMAGQQCAKRLWFEVHQPLLSEAADSMQLINGREFDRVAQDVRPGVVISRDRGLTAAVKATEKALSDGDAAVIYQAAFRSGNVAAIADVLRRNGQGFDLIENKVSTRVKDDHIQDIAYQALVLRRAGVRVKRTFVGHANQAFRLRPSGSYKRLVREDDVTADVRAIQRRTARLANQSLAVLARRSAPGVAMGKQCETPYPCPFMERCCALVPPGPEFPVSILPYGGKTVARLIADGLLDLRAVPPERLRSQGHRRVHAATVSGDPMFDADATAELRALRPPYSYLDFETLNLAVPRVIGTRPYEQCPFQWSLHVEETDGSMRHIDYLSATTLETVDALARALVDAIPADGPVFVYNAGFESGVLKLLVRLVPELKGGLRDIQSRLVDLLPITKASYYHPHMRGSWSIKDVLPTIDPKLTYERLTEVNDGGSAQLAYLEFLRPQTLPERRKEIEIRLKEYCGRDTYGLVALRRFLCRQPR